MSALTDGQSEVDTVTLTLPGYQKEITNWESYSLNRRFLTPTDQWTFTVDTADTALNTILVPGAQVQLSVNNAPQCFGYIDKKRVEVGEQGTRITITGRDVLGPVVDSTVDPAFAFTASTTLVTFLAALLAPFGIVRMYNADTYNLQMMTGYPAGVRMATGGSTVTAQNLGGASIVGTTVTVDTQPTRPDLHTLQLTQAKPHAGEGVFAYADRMMRRLGLTMWALADGSGVVVGVPDYSGAATQQILHKTDASRTKNNVEPGSWVEYDLSEQPSCIVATGFGSGQDTQKSKLRVIMVNELTGLDANGNLLPDIQAIKKRYPSADVIPLRSQVSSLARPQGDPLINRPFFLKDDESKNLAQLEAFARREMGRRQQKALACNYVVKGHTSDGVHPWAVNTMVTVDDDVFGVSGPMWVVERTFSKSGSGTQTVLKLIRPYTLMVSA